jgi:alkylation response protein AidB-like acyl-CoA dehydrogenase
MGHYRSSSREVEFTLFDVLGVDRKLGGPLYPELDRDTVRELLAGAERLAADELADAAVDADRHPPVFDAANRTVTVPESLRKAYEAYHQAGFWRVQLPPALGGVNAPRTVQWAVAEHVLGANAPVAMYAAAPILARVLFAEGTPRQRDWARLFLATRWGATMVLTEPDAGSDVGAIRTSAVPGPNGSWHIEGVKRFITSGEHDLADNIVHYVLARPRGVPGAGGPGTKGLSLFVVPKYHFDPETGRLGARNGVYATRLEDKMGLRGSATCELTFGAERPATGWLLGERHDGIRQMFLVIEHARMVVAVKAVAALSSGYRTALDHARTRVQGRDLANPGAAVPILRHPDVRRSLLLQKAYAEGLRALVLYTADWQDRAAELAAAGDEASAAATRVAALLVPVVKGCAAERAYELLGQEALQTLGGSGYVRDHPLEQYVRDAKIDSLYEGTTAIQSLDLFFRKIARDGGAALGTVLSEVRAFANAPGQDDRTRQALGEALGDVSEMVALLCGYLREAEHEPAARHKIGLHARRLLLALGDLLVGWLLHRQAAAARARIPADSEFSAGKVAVARFFADEVLPRLAADRTTIARASTHTMALPAGSF